MTCLWIALAFIVGVIFGWGVLSLMLAAQRGDRINRSLLFLVALGMGVILLTGQAQAQPHIIGGTAAQRAAVRAVLAHRPGIVRYIEGVWPFWEIRICYGGHAFPGRMDVNRTYRGIAFTANVVHELGHMVQLAADAEGGYPAIAGDWLVLMTARGAGPQTWVWTPGPPYYGRNNPWEVFAENIARACYGERFTGRTTPNCNLLWLSRAEMYDFLLDHGCRPADDDIPEDDNQPDSWPEMGMEPARCGK